MLAKRYMQMLPILMQAPCTQKDTNLLNDRVVSQRNSLLVQLPKASLVDQFPHALQVGIPKIQRKRHGDVESKDPFVKSKLQSKDAYPKVT
jgi:hypothetical protein